MGRISCSGVSVSLTSGLSLPSPLSQQSHDELTDISIGSDQTIRVWSTRERLELARLTHHSPIVNAYWLEGDAGVIVLTDDGLVSKWTKIGPNAWKWAKVLNAGDDLRSDQDPICFAYAKDRIAVSFPRLGVKVWIFSNGVWHVQRSILRQNVTAITFMENGEALLGGTRDGALWYCEIPNGTLRAYAFLKSKIISLDLSPTGTHVLVGSSSGGAALVALRKSENKGHIEKVYSLNKEGDGWAGRNEFGATFATKGQAVLFASVDSCALVWDRKKGGAVYGLEHDEGDIIEAVATVDSIAGREGCMVSGTRSGQLCWWALPVAAGQGQGKSSGCFRS
ncbi:WD40-repeat-containing domain protein [Ephemerocybe angulata]|uniref:WD40-repeat-containing domain protein n=1 Tax=Ephemerocybe angulata TaxID=980116 RepID=A0A8H6MCY3_9AGAR|nr:WD40-repeat-containing domain protein [Tulosesus angulatus]